MKKLNLLAWNVVLLTSVLPFGCLLLAATFGGREVLPPLAIAIVILGVGLEVIIYLEMIIRQLTSATMPYGEVGEYKHHSNRSLDRKQRVIVGIIRSGWVATICLTTGWIYQMYLGGGASLIGRMMQLYCVTAIALAQGWLAMRKPKGFLSSLGVMLGYVALGTLLMVSLYALRDVQIPFHSWL